MARLPAGYRLVELDETGSTNTEAVEAARRGENSGLWITAARQTAGRGSRGRQWASMEGNLFASLLLVDPAPLRRLAELTFVASLAVRDAIASIASRRGAEADMRLKWPNDILCNGAKVCGILLENHELADGRRAVVTGIGVNLVSHPENTLHRAGDLRSLGIEASPSEMLEAMADAMAGRLDQWDRGAGFAATRRDWLERAAGLGERIRVRMPGREIEGIFADIDADGMLCLSRDCGTVEKLSVADIFFPGEHEGRA